jgi:hypothetical protein
VSTKRELHGPPREPRYALGDMVTTRTRMGLAETTGIVTRIVRDKVQWGYHVYTPEERYYFFERDLKLLSRA